uniref:Uncharacterized protein n=1 Tax=Rhizophora mucronata TaxID=61149 RepID=A0A2P2N6F6_RHIMU
MFWISNFLV